MKRPDNSVLFGIRKGISIYFNDVIERECIKENVLELTDVTRDTLQTTQIYMDLRNSDKGASCILVNCVVDISWEEIIVFIQTVSSLLHLQFVSAGYDVVSNAFWYPGIASYHCTC